MRGRLLAVLLCAALVAASCGDDDPEASPAAQSATTTTSAASSTTSAAPSTSAQAAGLALSDSELGSILVDAKGRTLYLFMPDGQGDSTCYDQCQAKWPPLAKVSAVGDGLDDSLLGTTTRKDGTTQATYNGWPLYYFAADAAPGDTKGQGIGQVWYVVGADGNAVGAPSSSANAPGY
jgi:predicted lipoprotein with Yx(FWY)xxD motif